MQNNDLQQESNLLKLAFQGMYLQKGKDTQPHRELHAANLLESESDWCTRRYVLMNLFPQEVKAPELKSWDWKREKIFATGWDLHEQWQYLFSLYGDVAKDEVSHEPELDLTHYLEDENLYFSPDAIIQFGNEKYLVEIKGIKQEDFLKLTDDLEQAISVSQVVAKARIQANNYLYFTGLQKAILLIENKNTQDFKVYVMERDYDLFFPYSLRIDEIVHNTRDVKEYGTSHIAPRTCTSRFESKAKNCPLRDICFAEKLELEVQE